MRRRDVIAGLGCLAGWPLVAQAREPAFPPVWSVDSFVATQAQPSPASAVTPDLLVAQVSPDRLAVTRTQNNLNTPDAPPFSQTIANRATVEKLYGDIQALPSLPAGRFGCPRDVGIRYRLDFFAASTLLVSCTYAPSGCASVALSDGTVKSAASGSFRADLVAALGFATEQELSGNRR
jgi:hypothetical protein